MTGWNVRFLTRTLRALCSLSVLGVMFFRTTTLQHTTHGGRTQGGDLPGVRQERATQSNASRTWHANA
jgi:hypothetical protein